MSTRTPARGALVALIVISTAVAPASTLGAGSTTATAAARSSGPSSVAGPWIVYQTWDTQPHLRLVHPDGTGDRLLLDGGAHPDWSPDGRRVTYQVDDRDIWIVDVDGTHARRVFECVDPCILSDSPAWSPDGREIAFTTADAAGETAPSGSIVAVDVVTGAIRTLLETAGPEYPFYARWSPDGSSIVVNIQRFATTSVDDCTAIGTAIAVVALSDVAQPRMLTDLDGFGTYPDWSPDGHRIVFTTVDLGARDWGCVQDPALPSDLYTIAADGSDLRQLTHNPQGPSLVRNGTASGPLSTQPSWSSDGSSIIFVQVDGLVWPGYQLWTMGADGSDPTPFPAAGALVGTHARFVPDR